MANNNRQPRRPWNTQIDGDLWQSLYNTLKAKGPGTFRATKVKGHATDAMVESGAVKPEDKKGNDEADRYANEGVLLYGKDVTTLGAQLAWRHMGYAKMVKNIHTSFVEAILKRNSLLDKAKAKFPGSKKEKKKEVKEVDVEVPSYEWQEEGSFIKEMEDVQKYDKLMSKQQKAKKVQDFLQNTKIKKVDEGQQGISWLELYTLYKLAGGECMVDDPISKAAPKPSMRRQLKAFISTCRNVARLTMEQLDADLFRYNKSKKPRLAKIGICNHVPMVRFQVVISHHTGKAVAQAILKSQARRTDQQASELVTQKKAVRLQKLSIVNRTRWSKSIKPNKELMKQREADEQERKRRHQENQQKEENVEDEQVEERSDKDASGKALKFSCLECGNLIPASRKAFSKQNLDAKTWCGKCHKSWMAKAFACPCGETWYKCKKHGPSVQEVVGETQPGEPEDLAKKGKSKVRKARNTEDLEDLFKERKQRKFNVIEPAFRPSMLSAGLKRKFSYLCQEGTSN